MINNTNISEFVFGSYREFGIVLLRITSIMFTNNNVHRKYVICQIKYMQLIVFLRLRYRDFPGKMAGEN